MITGPHIDGNNYSSALANDCWGTITTPLVMSIMLIDIDGGGDTLVFLSEIRFNNKTRLEASNSY